MTSHTEGERPLVRCDEKGIDPLWSFSPESQPFNEKTSDKFTPTTQNKCQGHENKPEKLPQNGGVKGDVTPKYYVGT